MPELPGRAICALRQRGWIFSMRTWCGLWLVLATAIVSTAAPPRVDRSDTKKRRALSARIARQNDVVDSAKEEIPLPNAIESPPAAHDPSDSSEFPESTRGGVEVPEYTEYELEHVPGDTAGEEPYVDAEIEAFPPGRGMPLLSPLCRLLQGPGPMDRDSWLYRPWSVGFFSGGLFADDPITNVVDAGTGYMLGFHSGVDLSDHFGAEMRFGFSKFSNRVAQTGIPLGNQREVLWSGNMLIYPWGDSRVRPFFLSGLGLADVQLKDEQNTVLSETMFTIPIGGGIKYMWSDRVVFRGELIDYIVFGNGSRIDTLNELTLTAGIELRFGGGARTTYWPWNPGRDWW